MRVYIHSSLLGRPRPRPRPRRAVDPGAAGCSREECRYWLLASQTRQCSIRRPLATNVVSYCIPSYKYYSIGRRHDVPSQTRHRRQAVLQRRGIRRVNVIQTRHDSERRLTAVCRERASRHRKVRKTNWRRLIEYTQLIECPTVSYSR